MLSLKRKPQPDVVAALVVRVVPIVYAERALRAAKLGIHAAVLGDGERIFILIIIHIVILRKYCSNIIIYQKYYILQ